MLGLHRAVRAALGVGVFLLSRTLTAVLRRIDAAAVLVKLDDLALGTVLAQVQARAVLAALRLGSQLSGEIVLGERLRLIRLLCRLILFRQFLRIGRLVRHLAPGEGAHHGPLDGVFVGLIHDLAGFVDLADPIQHALQTETRHSGGRANASHERIEAVRIAALTHHVQRARALARTGTRPEVRLEAIEHALELRRRPGEIHRRHDDQLVGILEQRVHVVHVVADGATARRLVLGALLLEDLVLGGLLLGHRALRLALAEIAGVAAGHVERGHGRQIHLVFRALLDAAFEQKVRKRTASPLDARRPDDDQAFHSQFLSVAAVCACSICQGVGGRSNNARAFCAI